MGAAGRAMLAEAAALLQDLRASMAATHALAAAEVNGSQCWPYVAGRTQCAELAQQSSKRDSEPWRTYAEMAWSGALLPDTLADIIAWNRNNAMMMKGGMMSGTYLYNIDIHYGIDASKYLNFTSDLCTYSPVSRFQSIDR